MVAMTRLATGIERIENGTGELVLGVELIEEVAHGTGGVELADRVETGVRTELVEHRGVVVANGTVVVLLRPARIVVHLAADLKEGVHYTGAPLRRELHATQGLREDGLYL
jgi:hypothetical protein